MKKIILFTVLTIIFFSSKSQVPSSCEISQILLNEYDRDVKNIALKRLFEVQSPDTILVKIPKAYIDTIFQGLAAIVNATSIPERDSVFNLYCVHNNNEFPGMYGGFLVRVDTSFSWTDAWQNLTTITGNQPLDEMLTKYHLSVSSFYNWSIGNYAVLNTDSTWNCIALMDSLKTVSGIISAELNGISGLSGAITYQTIGDSRFFDFYFEFNDCFDGCDNYRKWMFKVNSNCSVEYLGYSDWGIFGVSELPIPTNCNIFTSIPEMGNKNANVLITPNPSSGIFKISLDQSNVEKSNIMIYNTFGEKIYESKINSINSEIDLSTHKKGMYFIIVQIGDKIHTKKILFI